MAMIRYDGERDLQKKICSHLNKFGYSFQRGKGPEAWDIYDPVSRVYGEVKTNGKFAPAQILYAIAKEGIRDAKYIILANEYELRVYRIPPFETIDEFARRISPNLKKAPSSVNTRANTQSAYSILGNPINIYTYDRDDFVLHSDHPYVFVNESSYLYFKEIMCKYGINPTEFLNKFARSYADSNRLILKKDGKTIVDIETGEKVVAARKISNPFDIALIEHTRVRASDIGGILHKLDEMTDRTQRRSTGKFWSSGDVSEITSSLVLSILDPEFVFEPYVGGGSLIRPFVEDIPGLATDIDEYAVSMLANEFKGLNWNVKHADILGGNTVDEIASWLPEDREITIFTNPPFGTSVTNALSSKRGEIKNGKTSRRITIPYGATEEEAKYIGDTYGRGDLVLPAIAKMIEVIKLKGRGNLAFFSPFGVMLGRKRYVKLLRALLEDFEFLYGAVFPGKMFNGISAKMSISFTIWRYEPGIQTPHDSLSFYYEDRKYRLCRKPLLKDGWKYDERKNLYGEIAVQANAAFNAPPPKIMHTKVSKGGSEITPDNVKIPLNLPGLPDELVYALWSTVVGKSSIAGYPTLFNDCYTHLPPFDRQETLEILSFAVLYTLLRNDYSEGKIGFVGMHRKFVFGNERLTEGAKSLIESHRDVPINDSFTIGSLFDHLRNIGDEPEGIRRDIRERVRERLEVIGYWDCLPIGS